MSANKYQASPEFKVWLGIRQRCLFPHSSGYYKYGGRGITITPEWREDFAAFLAHVGRRPSPDHQLDRIDNNGHYEPGNVRWATRIENSRNRRNNVMVTINGVTKCASAWEQDAGLPSKTVIHRFRRGWSGEDLLKPIGSRVLKRKLTPEQKAKRVATLARLRAAGLLKVDREALSKARKRMWEENPNCRERDERGCFK